jgi:hypothetical protein
MTESSATEEALDLDPALEIEEQIPFDPASLNPFPEGDPRNMPEYAEAMRKASLKQYDHTFFEIFQDQLNGSLAATEAELSIEVTDSIMKAWPWIRYTDIPLYITYRARMLRECIAALEASFPKPEEILFKENVDDWKSHREAYMDLWARWTAVNNRWTLEWQKLSWGDRKKSLLHAVVADLTYIILGPEGMIEKFNYLADFDNPEYIVSAEESLKVQARIQELTHA